jgi:hypothetical protein
MKPELRKMKLVVGRFSAVALASGAFVGAALWLGTIWPWIWEVIRLWMASHIKWG